MQPFSIVGTHALAVRHPPRIHREPFDRLLIARARSQGVLPMTLDATAARHPGPDMPVWLSAA